MSKAIITIVIVAVVLVGGYFLFFRSTPRSTPLISGSSSIQPTVQPTISEQPFQPLTSKAPAAKENVVTYTDSGYSPSILKIKKGETVIFKNQSSRAMWTASAVHPTHRVYPTSGGCLGSTFDACAGIQPGNSWSFNFDIVGSWKYHNHLNPGDTGTIVVE